jgi:glutathione peroxidase
MRLWNLVPILGLLVAACTTTETGTNGDGTPTGSGTATPGPGKPKEGTTGETKPKPVDPTNDPNAKACTGTAGSIYAVNVTKLDATDAIPMCRFEGSVILVVNVASACGNTPQYKPLQEIYDKYRAQGFYVLGFPCNQFGAQESGTEKEISAFCTTQYGITFPMFAKGNVNPPDVQPLYQWIHAQKDSKGQSMAADVGWNFEKFLISRHGQILERIPDGTEPNDPAVIASIEKALAEK